MMAINKNLPVDNYLGIDVLTDPQETATPQGRAADDYLGIGVLGGQRNAPAAKARQASDYLGLEALGGAGAGIAASFTGGAPTGAQGSAGAQGSTGATNTTPPPSGGMQDAYQRLFDEFNALGLGALVSDSKDLLMKATSIAAIPDALRGTKAYMTRFSANDARIKAGLTALSPAEYLAEEDAYQKIMRNYGLPASYYKPGLYGKQEGFDALLGSDVSALELEDRISTAQQRVINANPEILSTLKNFYGDTITNGDILAYVLDPKNAIKDIQRKVTAAEIGAAQVGAGFNLGKTPEEIARYKASAEQLMADKVTGEQYQQAASAISEASIRGGQLASIYKESPYTQQTAEQAVLNTPGSAAAIRQTKKLTELEKAAFSGQSGRGVLSRERSGSI